MHMKQYFDLEYSNENPGYKQEKTDVKQGLYNNVYWLIVFPPRTQQCL